MYRIALILILAALFVTGCELSTQPSGSAGDAGSAQSLMPSLSGYTAHQADDIQGAISVATGGASAATGNLLGTVAVARIDAMIDCYQGVGAADARIYVSSNMLNDPTVGALAVINQARLAQNLAACTFNPGGLGAQSAQRNVVEPCVGSGSITYQGDSITYIYAATNPGLCDRFVSHFNALNGQ